MDKLRFEKTRMTIAATTGVLSMVALNACSSAEEQPRQEPGAQQSTDIKLIDPNDAIIAIENGAENCPVDLSRASKASGSEGELSADMRLEARERGKERDKWFDAMDDVAKRSKNEQASKLIKFARNNGRLAAPVKSGVVVLEDNSRAKYPFFVMPLNPGDKGIDEGLDNVLSEDGNASAAFLNHVNTLALPPATAYSELWRGVLGVHELSHACDDKIEPKENAASPAEQETPSEYARRERIAHQLQNELMIAIGGEKMEDVISREADRIDTFVNENGTILNSGSDSPRYKEELDSIFDKPASTKEEASRVTSVWIAGVFEYMDRVVTPEQADYAKTEFLLSLYVRAGIASTPSPEEGPYSPVS